MTVAIMALVGAVARRIYLRLDPAQDVKGLPRCRTDPERARQSRVPSSLGTLVAVAGFLTRVPAWQSYAVSMGIAFADLVSGTNSLEGANRGAALSKHRKETGMTEVLAVLILWSIGAAFGMMFVAGAARVTRARDQVIHRYQAVPRGWRPRNRRAGTLERVPGRSLPPRYQIFG